jgi:hypothetical protein
MRVESATLKGCSHRERKRKGENVSTRNNRCDEKGLYDDVANCEYLLHRDQYDQYVVNQLAPRKIRDFKSLNRYLDVAHGGHDYYILFNSIDSVLE